MRYTISGTVVQTVAIDLMPGEIIFSQTNSMCWMNDAIDMNTHTGGGFFAGLRRSFGGASFFTFLCAEKSVSLEIAWQKRIGAGFFGGEGFILQQVTGPGTVFLDLSGEVVERELAPGERLLVHAGHVGIMAPTVQFDIQVVRGFKNILFGGEGLFLATLTGPATSICRACRS